MHELGLGISEASVTQLLQFSSIEPFPRNIVLHADHADGSVNLKFVRDAFDAFNLININPAVPRDIHLYIADVEQSLQTITRFRNDVISARGVHLALEATPDYNAIRRLAEHTHSLSLSVITSIQTDPFLDAHFEMLVTAVRSGHTDGVSILTGSKEWTARHASSKVIELYHRLVDHCAIPVMYLDRNCTPERIQLIAHSVPIRSAMVGSHIWKSSNPVETINNLLML